MVQDVTNIGPGILSVTTASHGGYKLDRVQNAKVHPAFRQAGGWYEEDCRYAVVVVTFPAHFSETTLAGAHKSLKEWFPVAYTAAFGVEVKLEESHVLREQAEREAAKGKLQSLAAWGDWHAAVPAGFVGLCARVDGRNGPKEGADRFFLVPAAEYDTRSMVFVVDPARHQEVAQFT